MVFVVSLVMRFGCHFLYLIEKVLFVFVLSGCGGGAFGCGFDCVGDDFECLVVQLCGVVVGFNGFFIVGARWMQKELLGLSFGQLLFGARIGLGLLVFYGFVVCV